VLLLPLLLLQLLNLLLLLLLFLPLQVLLVWAHRPCLPALAAA
jgi:hypothetical protein